MNLVIKSLYVVAAMALLVALAGIANAATATWEENFDTGYTQGSIDGQNGWSAPFGNTSVRWNSDGGIGPSGAASSPGSWGQVNKSHGITIDTSGQVLYRYRVDVRFAPGGGDIETSGATISTGWRGPGGSGWFEIGLGVNDRWSMHGRMGGTVLEPPTVTGCGNSYCGNLNERPGDTNDWYTVGIDWYPEGSATGTIKRGNVLLDSQTFESTAQWTVPEDAMYMTMDSGGWEGVYFDNYILEENPSVDPILSKDFTWNTIRSKDWNVDSNWTPIDGPPGNPTAKNRANHTVTFGDKITVNRTVISDTDVTVRAITFDNNAASYNIAGFGNISLVQGTAVGPPPTFIAANQGTHQFQAPVRFHTDANVNVASASTLIFDGALNLMGHTITKSGTGTISIRNDFVTSGGTLNVAEGTVTGNGTVGGDLSNAGGIIAPGNSSGILTINGDAADNGQVPEPGSLVLLVIGAFVLLLRRR